MSAADGHSRNNMWRESVSAGRGVCCRDAEGDKGCWFGFESVPKCDRRTWNSLIEFVNVGLNALVRQCDKDGSCDSERVSAA